jgi:hypothetical protein
MAGGEAHAFSSDDQEEKLMRLFGAGLAVGVLAILGLAAPAGAIPVPPGTGGLKTAGENRVTEAQWVGGGNGWGAQRYRWHKRPAFFQGQRSCYGTPYGYSNWGYYNYGPCGAPHTTPPWWYGLIR